MAELGELVTQAQDNVNKALGYIADAEFREEHETRVLRYMQASAELMVALYRQNQALIRITAKQAGIDELAD